MYQELFVRILNISIISCYTIVVVMVLRALILRWQRKFAYLLWFVVFFNLCIPFRLSGPFSLVPSWIADFEIADGRDVLAFEEKTDYLPNEHIEEVVSATYHNYTSAGMEGIPGTDSNTETEYIANIPNEQITVTASKSIDGHDYESYMEDGIPGTDSNIETTYHEYHADSALSASSRNRILAAVWAIVVIVLSAGNLWAVWGLQRRLKNAEVFSEGRDGEIVNQHIRVVSGIETPFLWGLFSPVIYLPQTVDREECTYIIAHERYHRKRKDYIVKPLFFLIAVIHWFNPLVWAAYFLFVRDMEISCDEAVIANADEDIRKQYAKSLLKYAARQNGYTLTPITFGEPSLKCRIRSVLQYRERNVMCSFAVLCFVLVVMTGLLFKPQRGNLRQVDSYMENVELTQSVSNTIIGSTEHFEVYVTSAESAIFISTPDEIDLRIDQNFSDNYHQVPFLCEADFDADGEQELVVMGDFGLHGTGVYQDQLFITDRDGDGAWKVYELHEDIYLPMIHSHISSIYGEDGLELRIDGNSVGHPFADVEIVDASARYSAGARIFFGYGESGIVPLFADEKSRVVGSRDNPDKKIVLDAVLGVYSDTCVSGVFPGNHFVAELTYEGEGRWSLAEYHHEFEMEQ